MGQGSQMIFMLIIFFVIGYFLLYRPQKKRSQQAQKMRDSIKAGDKIVTIGGIEGRIIQVFPDSYEIQTGSKDSRIVILKSAVNYVIHPKKDKDGNEVDPNVDSSGIEWHEMPGSESSDEKTKSKEKGKTDKTSSSEKKDEKKEASKEASSKEEGSKNKKDQK